MSIDHLRGLRRDRLCVKAARREFDHCHNLIMRQVEPVHNLANSDEVPLGTLKNRMKQAGIEK